MNITKIKYYQDGTDKTLANTKDGLDFLNKTIDVFNILKKNQDFYNVINATKKGFQPIQIRLDKYINVGNFDNNIKPILLLISEVTKQLIDECNSGLNIFKEAGQCTKEYNSNIETLKKEIENIYDKQIKMININIKNYETAKSQQSSSDKEKSPNTRLSGFNTNSKITTSNDKGVAQIQEKQVNWAQKQLEDVYKESQDVVNQLSEQLNQQLDMLGRQLNQLFAQIFCLLNDSLSRIYDSINQTQLVHDYQQLLQQQQSQLQQNQSNSSSNKRNSMQQPNCSTVASQFFQTNILAITRISMLQNFRTQQNPSQNRKLQGAIECKSNQIYNSQSGSIPKSQQSCNFDQQYQLQQTGSINNSQSSNYRVVGGQRIGQPNIFCIVQQENNSQQSNTSSEPGPLMSQYTNLKNK